MAQPVTEGRREGNHPVRSLALVLCVCAGPFFFLPDARADTELSASVREDHRQSEKATREEGSAKRSFEYGSGWSLLLSPTTELYPRSIADPHRSGFALTYGQFIRSEIPGAGDSRLNIRLGGSYGLIRLHPADEPDRGYQLDIGANFLGQFDLDHALDNIGWDGLYHLFFTWGNGAGLAIKLGTFHDSSHVGDEYAERSGRTRFGYTREEALLGASISFARHWRVYGEAGRAYHLSDESLMEPWRIEAGLEYESPKSFWGGRMGWYAATDCSFYQENGWHGNVALQFGLAVPQEEIGRRYRFGIEYYRGRSVIGEFFRNDETSLSVGFWWDL